MYCKKCGKEIDYDAEICIECQGSANSADEHDFYTEENYYASMYAEGQARKAGLGRAITGAAFGLVALICSCFAMSILSAMVEDYGYVFDSAVLSTSYGLAVVSIGLGIPAVINGIKSIIVFRDAKKGALPKPIPTFICGIASCAFTVISVVYVILTVCLSIMILMLR